MKKLCFQIKISFHTNLSLLRLILIGTLPLKKHTEPHKNLGWPTHLKTFKWICHKLCVVLCSLWLQNIQEQSSVGFVLVLPAASCIWEPFIAAKQSCYSGQTIIEHDNIRATFFYVYNVMFMVYHRQFVSLSVWHFVTVWKYSISKITMMATESQWPHSLYNWSSNKALYWNLWFLVKLSAFFISVTLGSQGGHRGYAI